MIVYIYVKIYMLEIVCIIFQQGNLGHKWISQRRILFL